MIKKRVTNLGCGKAINPGDVAANRWGLILCDECDKKYPAPFMAVYPLGEINAFATCGMSLNECLKYNQTKKEG